ncbi:MAG: S8 family peptidase [Candidatus Bipolaricaulota bacterium]
MRRGLLHLSLLILLAGGLVAVARAEPLRLDPVLRALSSPAFRSTVSPEELIQQVSLAWDGVQLPPVHLRPDLTPSDLIRFPLGTWDDAQVAVLVRTHMVRTGPLPGLSVRGRHGRFVTGLADVRRLEELAAHPAVAFVEASRPVWPALDVSVPEVRADLAWSAPRGTTGEGVIVGVVDTGIDITHPDFRVDLTGDGHAEKSRILTLWDQKQAYDGTAARYGFHYGRVYTRHDLEEAIAIDDPPGRDDIQAHGGHGTHVAGIAAGGGAAGLPGVAPNADLVVVKSTFYTPEIVDAVDFVFQVAEHVALPAVVNLSLGGHSGPHDGTSNFESAIDQLVDRPGRTVVVAAGNEGDEDIHVGAEVRAPTTWHLEAGAGTVPVELWHDGDASFTVTVTAPTGESVTAHPSPYGVPLNTPSGNVWLENPEERDARNDDKVVYLELRQAARGSEWKIALQPLDQGGQVDGWVTDTTAGSFREADNYSTISEPGNARRVITVGAYTTKASWESVDGPQTQDDYTEGTLTYFSSRGPTRDGRPKPELAAPGAWIAAPLSGDISAPGWLRLPGLPYRMKVGTSMAAPHVAGAAALLLSLERELDWRDISDALTASARSDGHTGHVPNRAWGAGKLDAAAAVDLFPEEELPPTDRPRLELLQNPVSQEALMSYQLPEGVNEGELYIYDLTGRGIFSRSVDQEQGQLRWDLVTRWDRLVADGLYLVVLVTDHGTSEIQRLVVRR